MSEIHELIKIAAVDAVNAAKPMAICYGRIVALSPISVRLSQWVTLSSTFIICTESFKEKITAKKIKIGDTVLLLQKQGGQEFIPIDKVVK